MRSRSSRFCSDDDGKEQPLKKRKENNVDENYCIDAKASDSTNDGVSNDDEESFILSITAHSSSTPVEELMDYYQKHQILHIKNFIQIDSSSCCSVVNAIRNLYREEPKIIEKTFTLETKSNGNGEDLSAAAVFGGKSCPPGVYYCSFIAQGKSSSALKKFMKSFPLLELPFGNLDCTEPIWLFVGRNDDKEDLSGRREHVDAVSHDGTWHIQTNGVKVWYVRPADSPSWGRCRCVRPKEGVDASETEPAKLRVECSSGDLLLINTKLWWHQTYIPNTSKSREEVSVSFARDFYSQKLRIDGDENTKTDKFRKEDEDDAEYTNLEGLYASKRIAAGDIVLTEDEMPDCTLPRSENPTCEVAWLEDGGGALIALQNLEVGDWLTIAPSDSEESEEEEDSAEESG